MNSQSLKISFQTICIALFLLSVSIAVVILATPLYSLAIDWFSLEQQSGLSKEILNVNYRTLIAYLINPFEPNLQMPNFPSSINGLRHFKDVKQLFLLDLVSIPILGSLSYLILHRMSQQKLYVYYMKSFQWMIMIPVIIVVLGSVTFRDTFLLFHKIIFSDTTWMFDPKYDPIILALPEEYFMMCFIVVLSIFLLLAMSLEIVVRYKARFDK